LCRYKHPLSCHTSLPQTYEYSNIYGHTLHNRHVTTEPHQPPSQIAASFPYVVTWLERQPLPLSVVTRAIFFTKTKMKTKLITGRPAMPVLFLLGGPKMGFATRCPDKRQIWHGSGSGPLPPCQITRLSGQKCGNTAPKLSKFRILTINLPLRGHSYAQLLRNSHLLYESLGKF